MDNSDNTKPKTKGKSPKNDKGDEKKYNFRKRKIQKYKTIEESSSEDDSDWIPDEDFIVEESESEEEPPHPPKNLWIHYNSKNLFKKFSHLNQDKKDLNN